MQPPPLPPLRRPPASRANGAASAPASSKPGAPPVSHKRPAQSQAPAPDPTGEPVDVDTGLHTLSPEFLAALRKVVPRKRRAKLPYIVGLGLLAVVVVVGADPQT